MWLRRLVALVMIATCIGLNVLTILGVVLPDKTKKLAAHPKQLVTAPAVVPAPTLTLTSHPTTIVAGTASALTWSSTGNPTNCTASGSWSGPKTELGSESTGRIRTSGNYTYTLTCTNAGGKAEASTTVTVGNAPPPAHANTTTTTVTAPAGSSYCGGRLPCYGPHDLARHTSAGNCWGWNQDRVIDISGLDAGFHEVASGISSIQLSSICGHDLAPALNGEVSAEGRTRDHNQTTKNNADANEIPYFVGYFDPSKP